MAQNLLGDHEAAIMPVARPSNPTRTSPVLSQPNPNAAAPPVPSENASKSVLSFLRWVLINGPVEELKPVQDAAKNNDVLGVLAAIYRLVGVRYVKPKKIPPVLAPPVPQIPPTIPGPTISEPIEEPPMPNGVVVVKQVLEVLDSLKARLLHSTRTAEGNAEVVATFRQGDSMIRARILPQTRPRVYETKFLRTRKP